MLAVAVAVCLHVRKDLAGLLRAKFTACQVVGCATRGLLNSENALTHITTTR
jgi:hypothetical protein